MNKAETMTSDIETEAGKKCISCGKVHNDPENTSGWHRFSVYHNDKGNDNCNTLKHYDVCSIECYLWQIKKSIEELKNSKTGRIDGMDLTFAKKLLFFFGAQ